MDPGKYTIETFAKEQRLTRQSALNLISKLKKKGLITTSGGGKQKRIYTVYNKLHRPTNGFYDIVNKYASNKLVPKYEHYTYGKYTVEHAIIFGLLQGEVRALEATTYLFNHVTNWKRLFDLAKKNDLEKEVFKLYMKARNTVRCKKMPRRYYDKYRRPGKAA